MSNLSTENLQYWRSTVCSSCIAAATVGLSMNTTHRLNDTGLLILTGLMYLGRIGPLTFAIAFNLRPTRSRWVKYPPEHDILVG